MAQSACVVVLRPSHSTSVHHARLDVITYFASVCGHSACSRVEAQYRSLKTSGRNIKHFFSHKFCRYFWDPLLLEAPNIALQHVSTAILISRFVLSASLLNTCSSVCRLPLVPPLTPQSQIIFHRLISLTTTGSGPRGLRLISLLGIAR